MVILSADTSSKNGSIALTRFESESARTLAIVPLEGGTFSAQLVPQISSLLAKHNLTKSDLDGFAVASGPGSFTGLRVGLAAIKALAEILRKPIASVSLLEAIASEAAAGNAPTLTQTRCLAVMNARRNEVFAGEYDIGGEIPSLISESLLTLEEFVQYAESWRSPEILTPDANVLEYIRARVHGAKLVEVARPDASTIARLGGKKILAGLTVSPAELDATYIRRSDAEVTKIRQRS
jgi:tRNA threonylcarbamoyladenosine biosynthesis protein TsaB